jgi:hypothetical protein
MIPLLFFIILSGKCSKLNKHFSQKHFLTEAISKLEISVNVNNCSFSQKQMQNELHILYVGDLSLLCSTSFADALIKCGAKVHVKKCVGKGGEAFVTFCDPQSAVTACLNIDGMFFGSGQLRLNHSFLAYYFIFTL